MISKTSLPLGAHAADADDPRPGPDVVAAHLLGEPRQAGEVDVDLLLADERATGPAAPPLDDAGSFQRSQCLPQRHPADPERRGQLPLRWELVVGNQVPLRDASLERLLDARV